MPKYGFRGSASSGIVKKRRAVTQEGGNSEKPLDVAFVRRPRGGRTGGLEQADEVEVGQEEDGELGRRQIRGVLWVVAKSGFVSRSHWSPGLQPEATFLPVPGSGFWKHPKMHTAASTTESHPAPMLVELRLRNPAYKQEGAFCEGQ